jgi:signal transduction histidine kinase
MSRKRLMAYGVSVLAVAAVLALSLLRSGSSLGAPMLFLAAIMVSAWYGGLGPGLLATTASAVSLSLLWPGRFSPATSWDDSLRLGVFVLAALLISSLNARQRRLEAALRRRDRQKDELLAVLAHELRNPLSAILTAVELLRLRRNDYPDLSVPDVIERQTRHTLRLVNDLTDVSRIGLGKARLCREPLDLRTVATNAVEAVRPAIQARGHQLDVALSPAPVPVCAEASRLEQVVVNLLSNAARYTDPGGRIWLTVALRDDGAVIRVRDTGVGIAPAVLPHVFDLFVQGEDGARGGLGIGLNLVRSLVQLHGGEVRAFSDGPGRGSEFVVSLPAADAVPSSAPAPVATEPPAARSVTAS